MKNYQTCIKEICTKENAKAFAIISILVLSSAAFAAGTNGGLETLKTTATEIKDALVIIVGTLSVIYLVWVGIQAFAEKKSWSDFGWAVIHVAVIGAIGTIVAWAQALFK